MRATHTVAQLEVSASAYKEIAKLLIAAGYQHAFEDSSQASMIDMSGIGITPAAPTPHVTSPTYCWSSDAENFEGSHDTVESALSEARAELGGLEGAIREARTVWVGVQKAARACVNERYLGEHIHDNIVESLHEEMGEACERFEMDNEQKQALGKAVLDWIEAHVGFHCWAVEDTQEHTLDPDPGRAELDVGIRLRQRGQLSDEAKAGINCMSAWPFKLESRPYSDVPVPAPQIQPVATPDADRAALAAKCKRYMNEAISAANSSITRLATISAEEAVDRLAELPVQPEPVIPLHILYALRFYANRSHMALTDENAWDTVSGEPPNYWCDSAGTAMIEDGTVAAMTLRGVEIDWTEDDDEPPAPIEGEALQADPTPAGSHAATPPQAPMQGEALATVDLPPKIATIIESLHTQDNRITDNPLFAVQQKRRIYGLDDDYAEGIVYVDDEGQERDRPANGHRKVGYRDIWEFVTGCLTEQGCKDYIARDGHNLNEPRIYAYGSYRNAEWIALRKWLMGLRLASKGGSNG